MENRVKILIFDVLNSGHHWFYNKNIIDALNQNEIIFITNKLTEEQKNTLDINFKLFQKSKFKLINFIRKILFINRQIKQNDIDSYIDSYYDANIISSIILSFLNKEINFNLIMHWLPQNLIKLLCLKLTSKLSNVNFIVHNSMLKNELIDIGFNSENIHIIHYPNNGIVEKGNKDEAKHSLNLDIKSPSILLFGGTRYDKGLDIFLKAIEGITNPFQIIIAGKPQYFTQNYICDNLCLNNDQNIILDLDYIDDKKMQLYFKAADIVVLPYRKCFMGQSGPLTDGLLNECIVVGPDWFIIGDTIKSNKCGVLFKPEDSDDLRLKLEYTIENYEEIKKKLISNIRKYNELTSIEHFQETVKRIIMEN